MSELPLMVRIAFLVLAIFVLFLNAGVAFWFFVISIFFFYVNNRQSFAYYNTPEGKAALDKEKAALDEAKANKNAAIEFDKYLQSRFQQFSENPTDLESLKFVLKTLASFNRGSLKKWMRPIVIPLLKLRPLDKSIRDIVLDYAKTTINIGAATPNRVSSKEMYDAALEILSEHPDQLVLRQYALEVGRWHFGIQRPGRKVTIYDEQAIQNDITVRSK